MPLPYPAALAVTLLLEVPVWTVLLRVTHRCTTARAAATGLVVNLVSHPLFWFAVYPLLAVVLPEVAALVLAEALVVVGEAALAARCLWWEPAWRRPATLDSADAGHRVEATRARDEAAPAGGEAAPAGGQSVGLPIRGSVGVALGGQPGLLLGTALAANLLSVAAGLLLQAG